MIIDPYAIYVYCDAAMDYDSKNTGGVGVEIRFPEFVDLGSIKKSIGRYEGSNIERLELEAILQGMNELIDIFQSQKKKLRNIGRVIFITDRAGLDDSEKTSPYRIRDWRKHSWHNYEGKPIKNKELLDRIDKTRQKLHRQANCYIGIR
jgi:ribonuclease HI